MRPADGASQVPDQPYFSSPTRVPEFGSDSSSGWGFRLRVLGRRGGGERGLPGWMAVGLLVLIAGIGGLIDQISGASIRGAFNYGLIFASLVAILVVRRSGMFSVVIAPPLVYFVASAAKLYIASGGLKDRAALTDAAANWLVYGFPAIAGATAVVLLIASVRMLARR